MSVYKIFILLLFNRECMGRNVMTSFWILSSFECFFTLFSNRISFILPFSVNCSLVAMFQIMPTFCPHGQGEGVVNQMWTGLDRGRGVAKIPKFVRTSFMDDPTAKRSKLKLDSIILLFFWCVIWRSNHRWCSLKIFLKNFTKFTGKHPAEMSYLQ